jgi:hypothetical protein
VVTHAVRPIGALVATLHGAIRTLRADPGDALAAVLASLGAAHQASRLCIDPPRDFVGSEWRQHLITTLRQTRTRGGPAGYRGKGGAAIERLTTGLLAQVSKRLAVCDPVAAKP